MDQPCKQNFAQKVNEFNYKIANLHQYAATLQRLPSPSLQPLNDTVQKTVEELESALDVLISAEEGLKEKNEELTIERERVEEAQRHSYQELFEFAPSAYLVTNNQGKIKEANRVAAQLLNIKPNFLIGKFLVNFIPFEERRAFRQKLNQLLLTNDRQEWELRIRPRRSEIFEAAVSVSTICDWQRKPIGWCWLILDLTSRKQIEEKIRQIELQNVQLEATAKLRSHFLALMSHELRTPINAIAGFSQLLLRQSQQPLATNQAEMVKRIFKSSQHLLQLVEDILDFSKIEVGNLQLKLTEFNLAELIIDTTEEIRSLVDQKNLTLQVDVNIQNSSVINDSDRLRQVLVNLLSNAIKFTDTGNISVEVWELPSNRLAIVVKDTGIGIAQEDIQSIFQEFWQVNQSMTRKHGGTGLGLAITNKLVHLMQGKITVESQLGRGSTFRVELPRCVNEPFN